MNSLGREAVELAAMAGLPLEDWQVDALDLMMSTRADGRWACRDYCEIVGRQQGKTVGIGIPRVLAGLLLLGENLIMWSAHETKTAMEAFFIMRKALLTLGEPAGQNLIALDDGALTIKINNTNGDEGFYIPKTGQRVRFIARSKGSGRGFSGDTNLVDEAFAYTRAQQSALAPTLLARPNAQSVYLSSPPLDGRSGDVLYALRKRAEQADDRLGFRDWGLATSLDEVEALPPMERKVFLDDRAKWAASLPALGRGRVTEEAVDQLRRELDDLGYAREVLGCWPEQINAENAWAVIGEETWRNRGGAQGRPDSRVVFAVAASAPDAEWCSIAVAGWLNGELTVQVVQHRRGTSWVADELSRLRETHLPAAIVLDARSPADRLIQPLEGAGVPLLHPKVADIAQSASMAFDGVAGDRPSWRHYDQPELTIAVAGASQRPLGDRWTWQRSAVSAPLEAVTLAAWGLVVHGSKRSAYDSEDAELMVV